MVKPPKTMQPEHVDISRAGRRPGGAFKPDSFRNYMARKIDMQRKQFGEPCLPPLPAETIPEESRLKCAPESLSVEQSKPPRLSNAPERHEANTSALNDRIISPSAMPSTPPLLRNPQGSKTPTSALKKSSLTPSSKKRGVRFAQEGGPERKSKRRKTITISSSVIRKWNKRHGSILKRKKKTSRKERRRCFPLSEKDGEGNGVIDGPSSSANEEIQACAAHIQRTMPQNYELEQPPLLLQPAPSPPIRQDVSLKPDVKTHEEEETPPLADDPLLLDDDEESIEETQQPEVANSPVAIRRSRPDLFFYGVTIKVNGYTEPDNETLKRMIQRHGGQFECYETQRVTHIVAEHLSTAKATIFKKQKNPVPVVSPSWIVDSIEQRCQLPYGKYLIEEVRDDGQQKGIKEMFGASVKKAPRDAVPVADVTSVSTAAEIIFNDTGVADPVQTKEKKLPRTVQRSQPQVLRRKLTRCISMEKSAPLVPTPISWRTILSILG